MPKKLEEIIRTHGVLSQVIKNCKDLGNNRIFGDILAKLRTSKFNFDIDKDDMVLDEKEADVLETLNDLTNNIINEINFEENGIVLDHNTGAINVRESILQARESEIPIPEAVEEERSLILEKIYEIGKEETKKGFLENVLNPKNYINPVLEPIDDFHLMSSGIDFKIDASYKLKKYLNSFQTDDKIEKQDENRELGEEIENNLSDPRVKEAHNSTSTVSWLNTEKDVYEMQFIRLCYDCDTKGKITERSKKFYEKKKDEFLEKHPEVITCLNEKGVLSDESLLKYSNYCSNLIRAKNIEYLNRDNQEAKKGEFDFYKMPPVQKKAFIIRTLFALTDPEESIKRVGITRLVSLNANLVKEDSSTGALGIDEKALLEFYNSIDGKGKKYTDIKVFLKNMQMIQKNRVVDKKLDVLTEKAENGTLKKANLSDKENAWKEIEKIRENKENEIEADGMLANANSTQETKKKKKLKLGNKTLDNKDLLKKSLYRSQKRGKIKGFEFSSSKEAAQKINDSDVSNLFSEKIVSKKAEEIAEKSNMDVGELGGIGSTFLDAYSGDESMVELAKEDEFHRTIPIKDSEFLALDENYFVYMAEVEYLPQINQSPNTQINYKWSEELGRLEPVVEVKITEEKTMQEDSDAQKQDKNQKPNKSEAVENETATQFVQESKGNKANHTILESLRKIGQSFLTSIKNRVNGTKMLAESSQIQDDNTEIKNESKEAKSNFDQYILEGKADAKTSGRKIDTSKSKRKEECVAIEDLEQR